MLPRLFIYFGVLCFMQAFDVFYIFYGILQAEWEEVANRADLLKQENSSLKEELKQLQEKCDSLTSENTSLHVRGIGAERGW